MHENLLLVKDVSVTTAFYALLGLQTNGIVAAYEATITRQGSNNSVALNSTLFAMHSIGAVAPDGAVNVTDLEPHTRYTIRSRVFTTSSFNGSYQHVSNFSRAYTIETPGTSKCDLLYGTYISYFVFQCDGTSWAYSFRKRKLSIIIILLAH